MQFHIDNFIGTGALISTHGSSLSLRWYASDQRIASSGRPESMLCWKGATTIKRSSAIKTVSDKLGGLPEARIAVASNVQTR
jgi:hypothetical protein